MATISPIKRAYIYVFASSEQFCYENRAVSLRSDLARQQSSDKADQSASKPLKTSEMGTRVILVAYLKILPAFEKEVLEALNVMAEASNKEVGCEQFEANARTDSPQSIVIYEIYNDDDAFQLHKTSPHASKFFEFVKGKILNDKIEVVYLTALNGSK